jgi:branched-subunit amino acid transport protein AzlD
MIQRIQSLYLLAAAFCSGVLSLFLPLFYKAGESLSLLYFPVFTAVFILSTLISLFTIFRYRKRRQQVVAGRFNIILNFVVFGFLLYYWYENFQMNPDNMGFGLVIPVVVIIFLSLSNRHIMRDELLIRSADRLR